MRESIRASALTSWTFLGATARTCIRSTVATGSTRGQDRSCATAILVGCVLRSGGVMLWWIVGCAHHEPAAPIRADPITADSAELQSLFDADQADRQIRPPDWSVVGPRDRAREARVHEMLEAGKVVTALHYYNAAMIYQHAPGIEG